MTKSSIPFAYKHEVLKKIKEKKIILFGAGNIAQKTSRIFSLDKLLCIIDNSLNLQEDIQIGVKVESPKFLETIDKEKTLILICSTSFVEISNQLRDLGFVSQEHFVVSPILNDLRIIDDMMSINRRLFFTSGAPTRPGETFGGGIYELNILGDEWQCNKKIDGNCYGLIPYENNYIAIDTDLGIFEFDNDFNIIRTKSLPSQSRAHGVSYSKIYQKFFVTCSYLDAVIILDKNFNQVDQINLSKKQSADSSPQHHCNDCYVINDSLFVSMFSVTGNWKLDVFDGGIVEYNIQNKELIGVLANNLWMPHNVKVLDGSLHVLDSLRGCLKGNNLQILGDFPAFTRGLAYDDGYFYIGQSRNRNYSKNFGVKNNISIDAGIVVFDSQTKVSRFLQVSPKISEIHSIVVSK